MSSGSSGGSRILESNNANDDNASECTNKKFENKVYGILEYALNKLNDIILSNVTNIPVPYLS